MVLNLVAMGKDNQREKAKGVKGISLEKKKGQKGVGAGTEEWGLRVCSREDTVAGQFPMTGSIRRGGGGFFKQLILLKNAHAVISGNLLYHDGPSSKEELQEGQDDHWV